MKSWFEADGRFYLLLSMLWIGLAFLVDPRGEFPLNDDWSYHQAVRFLAEENRLQFNEWQAMSLVAQVFWGGFVCKIFGFSFTVLRCSSIFLGLVGGMVIFRWLRKLNQGPWLALLASGTLLANPFYFSLSYSFMTDVPFLVTLLLAFYCFWCALHDRDLSWLIWGTLWAVLATLIRQLGLLAPLAFGLAAWQRDHWAIKRFLPSFLPFVLSTIALYGTLGLMQSLGLLSGDYMGANQLFAGMSLPELMIRPGMIIFYGGFFLWPLVVYYLPAYWRQLTYRQLWLALGITLFIGLTLLPAWSRMPWGNIWYNWGIGPKLFLDTAWGYNLDPRLEGDVLNGVRAFGFVGALLLILLLASWGIGRWKIFKKGGQGLSLNVSYLGWAILIYSGFLLAHPLFFDRYTLPLFPLIILLICDGVSSSKNRLRGWWSIGLLTLIILFSATGTFDYLSWNRARWRLADALEKQNISPHQVDGGFEYNGWYLTGPDGRPPRFGQKSWWFVDDDEYVISFGPWCGYRPVLSEAYPRLWPPGQDSLWVLRRHIQAPLDEIICTMEMADTFQRNQINRQNILQIDDLTRLDSARTHAGQHALLLSAKHPFGMDFSQAAQPCDRYRWSIWRYPAEIQAGLVLASPDQNFYTFGYRNTTLPDSTGWVKLSGEMQLPSSFSADSLNGYLWNNSQDSVWFDDFRLERLR